MATITVTETINAPIDRVFAAATDIANAAENISGIDAIEVLSPAPDAPSNLGQVGLGFTWRETRTMFGKKATEDMSITEWTPPTGYVVEARSHGCHYRTPFTLEDLGGGETKITMTFTGTPETFMAKVMMAAFAFMTKTMTKCIAADLADIKRICEAG